MKPYRLFSLLWLCLLGLAGGASAQTAWRDLPPEERRQLRQQMREHWVRERGEEPVGREQIHRAEERPEENRRRWQDVPPEERQRLREEMRQQRLRERAGEGLREPANLPPPGR